MTSKEAHARLLLAEESLRLTTLSKASPVRRLSVSTRWSTWITLPIPAVVNPAAIGTIAGNVASSAWPSVAALLFTAKIKRVHPEYE
jgi:hypothetical protein